MTSLSNRSFARVGGRTYPFGGGSGTQGPTGPQGPAGAQGPAGTGVLDYTVEEQATGIDYLGAAVFQKTIVLGIGLNNNSLQAAHNANIQDIVKVVGTASVSATNFVPIPWVDSGGTDEIEVFADATNVTVTSAGDWSSHNVVVTLWYTKVP